MSDEKEPIDPDEGMGSPKVAARLFAILLLIVVTPFLLFAGYCGLAASATLIGPILLVVFGIGALITYKGVQALWMAHDPSAGAGWAIAFVIFAAATGLLYLSLS